MSLLLLLSGCRMPEVLASVDACYAESSAIATDAVGGPTASPSTASEPHGVLIVDRRWGDSPFVTEYMWDRWVIEVPAAGAELQISGGRTRRGSQAIGFESAQVQGPVTVISRNTREIVLDLDLSATNPTVGTGTRTLSKRVRARIEPPGGSCR